MRRRGTEPVRPASASPPTPSPARQKPQAHRLYSFPRKRQVLHPNASQDLPSACTPLSPKMSIPSTQGKGGAPCPPTSLLPRPAVHSLTPGTAAPRREGVRPAAPKTPRSPRGRAAVRGLPPLQRSPCADSPGKDARVARI